MCIHCSLHIHDEKFLSGLARQIADVGKEASLIGISTMTTSFIACSKLLKHLRKYSDAKIILGGIHPTTKPYEALEVADYVCVGEGEEALVELVEKLENNDRTDNIKNIYTKSNGKVITNKLRPLIQDLNDLPVPSFDLKDNYVYYRGSLCCLGDRRDVLDWVYKTSYFIVTSRGCPYTCNYCLNSALINIDKTYRIIRRRSNEHITQELKNLKKICGRNIRIGFVEDDFCAQSEKNIEKFASLYQKEIQLPFFVASTPSSLTRKKLELLIRAGLNRLEIGIQSINDRVNKDIYGRNATKDKVTKAINITNPLRHQVQFMYDVILDNPWEKDDTKIETLRFICSIPRPVTINMFSLTLYPGTHLYYKGIRDGILTDEMQQIYTKDHCEDIENNSINTLFVLYIKYKFPRFLIELGLKLRHIPVFNFILSRATIPLWKLKGSYRLMKAYFVLLYEEIKAGNFKGIKYGLALPFNKLRGVRGKVVDVHQKTNCDRKK